LLCSSCSLSFVYNNRVSPELSRPEFEGVSFFILFRFCHNGCYHCRILNLLWSSFLWTLFISSQLTVRWVNTLHVLPEEICFLIFGKIKTNTNKTWKEKHHQQNNIYIIQDTWFYIYIIQDTWFYNKTVVTFNYNKTEAMIWNCYLGFDDKLTA
jgi:hypothetical protein